MTDDIRAALQGSLRSAMRARDREAVSAHRSALAAIDNAGAVPDRPAAGALEATPSGAGATDRPGRVVSEAERRRLVQEEAHERRHAADVLPAEAAGRLRRQAELLDAALGL